MSHLYWGILVNRHATTRPASPFFWGWQSSTARFVLSFLFHVRGKGPKICEAFCCMVPVLFSSPDRTKSADSTSAALAPSKAERPKPPKTHQILINFTGLCSLRCTHVSSDAEAISTCKAYGVAVPTIASVISYSTCLGLDRGFCACRSDWDPARSQILSSTE